MQANEINEIYEELKDKSFAGAKSVTEMPELQRFQERLIAEKQTQFESGLEPDVIKLLESHRDNREEMKRVNAVIRALFA